MKKILLLTIAAIAASVCPAQTLIEIQGEADVSPFEGQTVTFNAKVTEYFGDFWFMQDEFGEWNGILVHESTLLVPPNPPWWDEPRQPEVGDELTVTGTVMEVDGNTQLMDVTLDEQTEFWLATPGGTETTAAETQNEALEGTRVRLMGFEVVTPANGDEEWIVTDGIDMVTCIGVDDEADPFPGDVYNIFGAIAQTDGEYKVWVGDIDVVSLDINDVEESTFSIFPNPLTSESQIQAKSVVNYYEIYSTNGQLVRSERVGNQQFILSKGELSVGQYSLRLVTDRGTENQTLLVR
jgi:hypothetical protein